jgi:YD repeat-containing protein
VGATGFNHVSVHVVDMDASLRFYTEVFGMEKIPTYTFAFPVQYLRLGDLQLHLFQRDTPAPQYHHIGIEVDDFEAVYARAKELGILEPETFRAPIRELPDGSVQMYIRDPAGNLIEIDWPDASSLDPSMVGDVPRLVDTVDQRPEAAGATLFQRA